MEPEIVSLLSQLGEAFDRRAWHGTNLRGSIRGVSAQEASWRPGPGRHNIWEIVLHTAYWKYAIRRRITGGKRGSFPYKGSNWFASPDALGEAAWQHDVRLLVQEHRNLCDTVASLTAGQLRSRAGGPRWTGFEGVRGIAFHDTYHAGQIQLLKRLMRTNRNP